MNRFACNSVTSESLRFTLRIEQFSMHVLKGYFVSPEFESESSNTKWSLVVGLNDGADYDNYIDVRLRRNECKNEEQLVKTKLSIVGFPYLPPLTKDNEEGVYFGEGRRDAQVLTVTKKQLFGYFGLNKLRLLPKDTLTLVCELGIHYFRVQTFDRRRDFEEVARHPGPARSVEYFAGISMKRKTFDFVRRYENFSVHCRSGRCVSPEFSNGHSDCRWSLVVNASDADFPDGSFDIRLKRSDSSENGEFVEVKVSVLDGSGGTSLSNVKRLYFRGSQDEESPILTIAKKDMRGWLGFNVFHQSRLIPDDALTLKCEITVFEETVIVFDSKNGFKGYPSGSYLTYEQTAAYLLVPLLLLIVSACYFIWLFITDYAKPLIVVVLAYTILTLIFTYFLFMIKNEAERLIEAKKIREDRRWRNRQESHSGLKMVPYRRNSQGSQSGLKMVPYQGNTFYVRR